MYASSTYIVIYAGITEADIKIIMDGCETNQQWHVYITAKQTHGKEGDEAGEWLGNGRC